MPPVCRIGVVLHDFALGGTERIAARLATAWAGQGAAVTLFCGSEDGPLRSLVGPGVKIIPAADPIARGFGSRMALGRSAAHHFAADPVDAIWVPGNYHWPVIPALRSRLCRADTAIVAQVSAALAKPQRRALRQWSFDVRMRHLLRGADSIVTLADAARNDAARILRHRRIRSIPLPALRDDAPPARRAPGGAPTILAAGRLVPEKGFAQLIEAFARLDFPQARLTIAGSGPDEARLRALTETLRIGPRVTFAGYVSDITPLLDQARLFVLASEFEGYPAVMVEALARGRAVVATDCTPATAALLRDPAHGRVVPIGDVTALSGAIAAALAMPAPDPQALAATVLHHRIDGVAASYLSLFADLRTRRPAVARAARTDRAAPAWSAGALALDR